MAVIKKNDFIELDYTGKTKDEGLVFDTTDENIARESGMHDKNSEYGRIVVCAGHGQVLKGLDDEIIGKETGKSYTIELDSDKAFGKRDAKLIQMIPLAKFRQQKIQPVPGLQLSIDGLFGIVKTVSGGRCMVDFNNPLAGREIVYTINIGNMIEDDKIKLKSLLKNTLGTKEAEIEIKDDSAEIRLKTKAPSKGEEILKEIAREAIPSLKEVTFTRTEKDTAPEPRNE